MGAPCIIVSSRTFRRQQCRGLIAGKWCCLLLLQRVCCFAICFCFTGQYRTAQEYIRVRVQIPVYIGYSPADDLYDTFKGWATLCWIALVERSLTRFPPPWRS